MFKKIGLILLSILTLFSLLNISYFMWEELDNDMLIFFNDNQIIDPLVSNVVSTWSLAYVSNINLFDKIYHLENNSFSVEQTKENIDISLSEGIFILDMNDISKKYKISYNWVDINLQSVGSFYIDTTSKTILIFSIDASVSIDFLSKDNELINSYFMYPHEFIKFNPSFNIRYKNADLYRIRTITKNGYLKNKLLVKDELYDSIDNNENVIWRLIWSNNIKFFNSFLNNKKERLDKAIIINKKISSLKNISISFKEQVEKYSYYFLNNSKKIVVLQNSIYNNLIELYNLDVVDRDLIWKTLKDLVDLKKISIVEYNKSVKLKDDFYRIVLLNSNKISEHKVYNFVYLKLEWKIKYDFKSNIELKNIYLNYDFFDLKNKNKNFNNFLSSYLENNWIIEDNNKFTLSNKKVLIKIESFNFLLKEYINANLFIYDLKDLGSQINILKKYISLNEMIYFSWKIDPIKVKTSLLENKDLLEKLEKYLKFNFFEENRRWKLLIRKNKLEKKILYKLEKNIKKILNLYEKNKAYLSNSKYIQVVKKYWELEVLLNEEIYALKDYNNYTLSADEELKDIFKNEEVYKKIYTVNDINNYLKQFSGLSFDYNDIKKQNNFFEINNIFILWEKYNFVLYPEDWNSVFIKKQWKNILWWSNKTISYELNYQEQEYLEKIKSADWNEKFLYNFSNFFINKLNNNVKNTKWNEIDCSLSKQVSDGNWWCVDVIKDSAVVMLLKTDKLIWKEFLDIKDFFDIKYNNIKVNIIDNKYSISLEKVIVNIWLYWNENKRYIFEFNSDYNIKKHVFFNISFKIKESKSNWIYLFNWDTIKINNKELMTNEIKIFLQKYIIDNIK